MIERRELALPEMQREYVWRGTRVRDLLDSLYRGYPSGVILTWQTSSDVAHNDFAVATAHNTVSKPMLLLDGQQRLTSLSAVIRGEHINVRGRKRPIDILFNLDHPEDIALITEVFENGDDEDDQQSDRESEDSEEVDLQARMRMRTFVVASKAMAGLPTWVSVTEVMKDPSDVAFLEKAGVTDLKDPNYQKYTTRLKNLRAIKDYVYRMDVLEDSLSYEEVTEIFVRVNSLGAKLRSSDLALAQITARWPGSLAKFRDFQQECEKLGFDLDIGTHLRMLIALLTNQSRFKTAGSISREQLEAGWKRARRAMQFAINFTQANAGINSPTLLSSPFALIALGYWADARGFAPSQEESQGIRRWLLLANAKGRWSRGSSETLLDQDLAAIRDGGGHQQLLDRLTLQVGRLDIQAVDLEGRTSRSSLFKTMFLAFAEDGAKDWTSQLAISVKHAGAQDKLQFHHIFPKAYLRDHGPGYKTSQVDDIANLAFICGSTNLKISAKAPSDYLTKLSSRADHPLEAQQVPLDTTMYEPDAFLQFLAARRELIAARLNEFLASS